jgi:transposase
MKKAMRLVFCKVKNQIKDAHHKISKFLCENYDAILLPDFKSSEMVQTGRRMPSVVNKDNLLENE